MTNNTNNGNNLSIKDVSTEELLMGGDLDFTASVTNQDFNVTGNANTVNTNTNNLAPGAPIPSMVSALGGSIAHGDGLPPLKLVQTGKKDRKTLKRDAKKVLQKTGGFDESMGRLTPRCLREGEDVSLEELRRELKK